MIIINLEQGSDAWFQEKLGKPSASNASKIIANDGKQSKQRTSYLYELAGEIITGRREEGYKNAIMEAGNERENESRKFYELTHSVEVQEVGVIYKDEVKRFLCSPDGLIGNEYGVELKNPLPKTQVKYLLEGKLPEDYFGQVQFSLYVTGFKLWHFLSYVPAMKPLFIEVKPDKEYQEVLRKELNAFCDELDSIVKKLKEA